jgi:UDP-glucose 4-epimerase
MGAFYRIPADNRDLNYNMYFTEGKNMDQIVDYNSSNTNQLDFDSMYKMLYNLNFIKEELIS